MQGGRRAVAVALDAPGGRAEGDVGREPLLVAGKGRAHAGGIGRGRQAADEIVLVGGGAARAVHGVGDAPGRVVFVAVRAAEGVDDPRQPAVGVVFVAVRAAEGIDAGDAGAEFVVDVLDALAAGPDGFDEPPGGVVAVRDGANVGIGGALERAVGVVGEGRDATGGFGDGHDGAADVVGHAPGVGGFVGERGRAAGGVVGGFGARFVGEGRAHGPAGGVVREADGLAEGVGGGGEAAHGGVAEGGRMALEIGLPREIAVGVVFEIGFLLGGVGEDDETVGLVPAVAVGFAHLVFDARRVAAVVVGPRGGLHVRGAVERVVPGGRPADPVVAPRVRGAQGGNPVGDVAFGVMVLRPGARAAHEVGGPAAPVVAEEVGAAGRGHGRGTAHDVVGRRRHGPEAVHAVRGTVHGVVGDDGFVAERIHGPRDVAVGVVFERRHAAGGVGEDRHAVQGVAAPALGGAVGAFDAHEPAQGVVAVGRRADVAVALARQRAVGVVGEGRRAAAGADDGRRPAGGIDGHAPALFGLVDVARDVAAGVALEAFGGGVVVVAVGGDPQVVEAEGDGTRGEFAVGEDLVVGEVLVLRAGVPTVLDFIDPARSVVAVDAAVVAASVAQRAQRVAPAAEAILEIVGIGVVGLAELAAGVFVPEGGAVGIGHDAERDVVAGAVGKRRHVCSGVRLRDHAAGGVVGLGQRHVAAREGDGGQERPVAVGERIRRVVGVGFGLAQGVGGGDEFAVGAVAEADRARAVRDAHQVAGRVVFEAQFAAEAVGRVGGQAVRAPAHENAVAVAVGDFLDPGAVGVVEAVEPALVRIAEPEVFAVGLQGVGRQRFFQIQLPGAVGQLREGHDLAAREDHEEAAVGGGGILAHELDVEVVHPARSQRALDEVRARVVEARGVEAGELQRQGAAQLEIGGGIVGGLARAGVDGIADDLSRAAGPRRVVVPAHPEGLDHRNRPAGVRDAGAVGDARAGGQIGLQDRRDVGIGRGAVGHVLGPDDRPGAAAAADGRGIGVGAVAVGDGRIALVHERHQPGVVADAFEVDVIGNVARRLGLDGFLDAPAVGFEDLGACGGPAAQQSTQRDPQYGPNRFHGMPFGWGGTAFMAGSGGGGCRRRPDSFYHAKNAGGKGFLPGIPLNFR